MSRESRLLVLTITVSAIVLLLLAQLRFPEPPVTVTATPPLERLAARASFEELATRVADLERTIAPGLVVLRIGAPSDPPPVRLADLTRPDQEPPGVRHVPALHIDATTAVAAIPPAARINGIVRAGGAAGVVDVAAQDPIRGLARVHVPERPVQTVPQRPLDALQTPTYVVAVEGTAAGLTVRPIFLGRSDRFQSPRWARPLLPLGGIVVSPGALMFTLDGEFLGAVVVENATFAIASASDVIDVARALPVSPPAPIDPGIAVQPLLPRLAVATGASRGVVVVEVVDDSPAAGVLEAGDVIVAVDGIPGDLSETVLLELGARLAAGPVGMTVVRGGETLTVELQPGTAAAVPLADALELQTVARTGTRVSAVEPDSVFAAAGVRAGDVIVKIGDRAAPSAAQVRDAVESSEPGALLLLTIRRDDREHFVTVQMPASDVAR